MDYRVTNIFTGERANIRSPDPAGAVRTFWREKISFPDLVTRADGIVMGYAYNMAGKELGYMMLVPE